ncbi:acyltransferase family protein [Albimonas pacifica]|uniref:Peptidoglycan/LPS O-acetylase OafA/YrhL, contains acyltransferase and SGNH-hydrolase domains n=1 Tax=Albimonas pacifica TaxID=1114924 RepID=A0A1I3JR41_9RHOB|nr:acyltransferase family protein [Albimonas pacifica]SFI62488.1 Peptidoglycan/LPS O-acetylase OafA/YrhL, contains acyltransferase and SGNH-hydrolase domains [Albimonas pacifica]
MSTSIGYRPDIDGLRSVAVVPVVLFHAGLPGVGGGYVGVDVFFVISGFLITSILRREIEARRFSILGFYERRARRILPALFAMLAVTLLASAAIQSPKFFAETGKAAVATALFASNLLFWKTNDYFAPALEMQPLLHTWSLAVEEQFYIVFPPLLWALALLGGRWVRIGLAAALAGSFALAALGVAQGANWAFFLLPPRAWELGLGAALAYGMAPAAAPRALREAVGALGLAAILAPVFLYSSATPFPGLAAAPPALGAAALIWAGRAGGSGVNRLLATRLPVAIGLLSYSLYLWHWPVLTLVRTVLVTTELPMGAMAGALLAILALSWASWRFVERPFRSRGPDGVPRGRIFAGSLAGIAVFAGLGWAAYATAGAPGRFPPEVQRIYALAENANGKYDRCGAAEADALYCPLDPDAPPAGPAELLIWGDSHARMLLAPLDDATRALGIPAARRIVVGCPPMVGFDRPAMGGRLGCSRNAERVLADLEGRPDMATVILMAHWLGHFGAGAPGHADGGTGDLRETGALDLHGDRFERLSQALEITVDRLLASGRRVILLGPTPVMDFEPPEMVAQHTRWNRIPPPGPSLAAIAADQRAALGTLERLAEKPGVTLVPLTPTICGERCPYMSDGLPIYRDADHLSLEGARRHFSAYLTDALTSLGR